MDQQEPLLWVFDDDDQPDQPPAVVVDDPGVLLDEPAGEEDLGVYDGPVPDAVEVSPARPPAATAISQKLAPGGGGGGCWIGGPRTASTEKWQPQTPPSPSQEQLASDSGEDVKKTVQGGLTWTSGVPRTDEVSAKILASGRQSSPDGFALFGRNLFGDDIQQVPGGRLAERFTLPPFSVLNAREGAWQDRKRAWLSLGIQSELGRGATGDKTDDEAVASYKNQDKLDAIQRNRVAPGGSARPACDYSNRERGDGRGRPIDG